MIFRSVLVSLSLLIVAYAIPADARDAENFANRKAVIVNSCPHIELSKFSFGNEEDSNYGERFIERLSWTNVGTQSIIAFELVMLHYNAFNQRAIGTRMNVQGKNSVDWSPLAPGESGGDGVVSRGSDTVYTDIVFVRRARLADGTVWQVNDAELVKELRKVAPDIKEIGSLQADEKRI